jgi:P-type Ca2+ transporter type 2C
VAGRATPHPPGDTAWHTLGANEVLARTASSVHGLTSAEAARRLAEHGPNRSPSVPPRSAIHILADQFRNVIVALLIAAAALSVAVGDRADAFAIGVVLLINVSLGFLTELRARRSMDALLGLEVLRALVVRDGVQVEIDARGVVPGDVIDLDEARAVPADARLIHATELSTIEAALTGESMPVAKRAGFALPAETTLAERAVMVYKATIVATGGARAVVGATGSRTELGRIGEMVRGVEERRTPLEQRLDQLGRRLIWVTLGAVLAVVAVGMWRGATLGAMLELGIALAVAAVPEGLPAIATITMAVGVRRMARRHASVRRLSTVETLGAVTVICCDKTGTLTTGEMTATTLWVAEREYRITGTRDGARGGITLGGVEVRPAGDHLLEVALRTGALANRGSMFDLDGTWRPHGDPTDVALLVAARKGGLSVPSMLREQPEIAELPFSSERQLMATFHRDAEGALVVFTKGAPRRVLALCESVLGPTGQRPLDDTGRASLRATNDALAARGLRVLALATGAVATPPEEGLRGLTFVGYAGVEDPAAPGVAATIARFGEAGIRTLMLTGDQRLTAMAVGRELGLVRDDREVADGRELERLSEDELALTVGDLRAVSRVSPAAKLRIVNAERARGAIVAMLGDGVNDAPALKAADVGVAMGKRGTDVAKEAAAVVLQDDRFETIGAAVEEGRVIYENIRKFVFYLFSCNLAEVMVLLVAGVAGLPLPLLPLQILWLNLVTDTFPALALALEPADTGVMRRPPRDPAHAIISGAMARSIGFYAALITAVTLTAFAWTLETHDAIGKAVTMSFLTLSLAQLFHLGNARSRHAVTSRRAVLSNRYALGAVALTLVLQILAVHFAPLARVLGTTSLSPRDWLIALLLGAVPAVIGQLLKSVGQGTVSREPAPHDASAS